MHPATRWIRNIVTSLALAVLVAVGLLYGLSERVLRRVYQEPVVMVPVPSDSASIAEGGRIALIHGCRGCHNNGMTGNVWEDDFLIGRINAPSLTLAAEKYSDDELIRIIRRGVRPDGRSVWGMPSEMFAPLTDTDVALIIAYLRSVTPAGGLPQLIEPGPLARLGILSGEYLPATTWVARTDSITAAGYYPAAGEPHAEGAYLARTACPECHNLALQGYPGDTPDLSIAAGYTLDQFRHFFKTGQALGGRELELMSDMARNRYSNFTEAEVTALYDYLVARAQAQTASRTP